jgi:hypothetical protein
MQLAHAGRKGSCSRPWEGDAPLTDGRLADARPVGDAVPPRLAGAEGDGRRATWRVCAAAFVRAAPRAEARRLRHDRAAHGARLPAVELPVAAVEPCAPTPTAARSRTAHALPARGLRRRARRVAGRQADVRAHLGDRLDRRRGAASRSTNAVQVARWLKEVGCRRARRVERPATRRSRSRSTAACTRCRSPSASATRPASR